MLLILEIISCYANSEMIFQTKNTLEWLKFPTKNKQKQVINQAQITHFSHVSAYRYLYCAYQVATLCVLPCRFVFVFVISSGMKVLTAVHIAYCIMSTKTSEPAEQFR